MQKYKLLTCYHRHYTKTHSATLVIILVTKNYSYHLPTIIILQIEFNFSLNSMYLALTHGEVYQKAKVPSYHISSKDIFDHGRLHWLVSYNGEDGARQVIWFDVENEEFGLIKPPKTISKLSKRKSNHPLYDHFVNLDGQVGYYCNRTTEVCVLNHKKEWVLHCNLEDHYFPFGYIKVLESKQGRSHINQIGQSG